MYRHEDIKTILFLIGTSVLLYLPYFIDLSFTSILFLLPLTCWSIFTVNVIIHNVSHAPIFKNRSSHLLLTHLLTILHGNSFYKKYINHVLNHHVHFKDTKDWMHANTAGAGNGFIRSYRYLSSALWLPDFELRTPPLKISTKLRWHLRFDSAVLLAQAVILVMINVKVFLLLTFPAFIFGTSFLGIINLLQHENCDLQSEINHSRNFTSPILNWFIFNNGYHTFHHENPECHWSDLPALHLKFSKNIDPELIQSSFFSYFFKKFLFSESPNQ